MLKINDFIYSLCLCNKKLVLYYKSQLNKKMKAKLFFIAAIALIVGCSKQGPEGPAGPTGATGPAGPKGTDSGITTQIFIDSIPTSSWKMVISGFYSASVTDNSISNLNLDNVSVVVTTVYPPTSWEPLPFNNYFYNGDQMEFYYSLNSVSVLYYYASPPNRELYLKVTVTKPD